jgi:8-oxo-dGTP diphosphatase
MSMKLLKEMSNKTQGIKSKQVATWRLRRAARAVLFGKDGRVAILHASKNGYHKIAGGGVESGEDIKTALAREIKEETGCTATVGKEVGMIIENRDNSGLLQISYCYLATVKKYGEPAFTNSEKSEGFKLEWMSLSDAIKTIKREKSQKMYEAKFMTVRDLTFLEEAKKISAK